MAAGVLGDTATREQVALQTPASFWMVIRSQVYDLTEFKEVHRAARKFTASAGWMERAYEKVDTTNTSPAMLDMYKIGRVPARLGTRWDYALMPDQMAVFRTDEALNCGSTGSTPPSSPEPWANDVSVRAALTDREQPHETTPLKTVLFLESIRLASRTVDDLCGSDLLELWCVTAGIWRRSPAGATRGG